MFMLNVKTITTLLGKFKAYVFVFMYVSQQRSKGVGTIMSFKGCCFTNIFRFH